jgi:hypothetical protein
MRNIRIPDFEIPGISRRKFAEIYYTNLSSGLTSTLFDLKWLCLEKTSDFLW